MGFKGETQEIKEGGRLYFVKEQWNEIVHIYFLFHLCTKQLLVY